jgi:hypothetical protein
MASWLLFVDESGNFDGREGPVSLGGLLLQHDSLPTIGRGLRLGVEKIYPHVPYPPHATELNLAAGHLASWRLWPVQSIYSGQLENANLEFEKALRIEGASPLLQGFLNAECERKRPKFPSLQGCDQWMQANAPKAMAILEEVRDASSRNMVDFLSNASSVLFNRNRRCILTGVVECGRHEWDGSTSSVDRYLDLLRTLFEEVFLFLRDGPPGVGTAHSIAVRVASRRIYDAARALTVSDIDEQVRCASVFPLYPSQGGHDTIEVEAQIEPKYDGNAHAGVVVADFLCNKLRRVARDGTAEWLVVRQAVKGATGLSPDVVPSVDPNRRTKPAVAAQGASWTAITHAFARGMAEAVGTAGSPDSATSLAPGWPRDCVDSWAELAGRIR